MLSLKLFNNVNELKVIFFPMNVKELQCFSALNKNLYKVALYNYVLTCKFTHVEKPKFKLI